MDSNKLKISDFINSSSQRQTSEPLESEANVDFVDSLDDRAKTQIIISLMKKVEKLEAELNSQAYFCTFNGSSEHVITPQESFSLVAIEKSTLSNSFDTIDVLKKSVVHLDSVNLEGLLEEADKLWKIIKNESSVEKIIKNRKLAKANSSDVIRQLFR